MLTAIKIIIEKIIFRLRCCYYKRYGFPFLKNVTHVKQWNRRALLVYEVFPFLKGGRGGYFAGHTRWWRNLAIAEVLSSLGYCVDVVYHKAEIPTLGYSYDLMIGLQPLAFSLAKELSDFCAKVYITTGSEASFYNQQMNKRINEIEKRHGTRLEMSRPQNENFHNLRYFDALATLGNEFTASTFRPFFTGSIHTFNNHTALSKIGRSVNRSYDEAVRHFLFFGGGGQIILGLDILLDVFCERLNLHLYVCSPFKNEPGFVDCFHDSLFNKPNIHSIGFLPLGSEKYRKIVETCGSVIVPQCSGASNGSVVTCMHNGLVPIVSQAAGITTDDFGILLKSIDHKDVARTVDSFAAKSGEWLKEKSERTMKTAQRDYSQDAFRRRFTQIVKAVAEDENR